MPLYFEKWFRAKNRPILPLSEQEAKLRHAERRPYVAVLGDDAGRRVIAFADAWVSVMFLDERDRICLKYDFKRADSERLFLSMAMHLQYRDDSGNPHVSITFVFKPDGSILLEKRNLDSGEVEEKESHANPEPNWEAYPLFGDYTSISRLNRETMRAI